MTFALAAIVLAVLGVVKMIELFVDVTERVDEWRLARRYRRNKRMRIVVPRALVVRGARDQRINRTLDQIGEPTRFIGRR